MTAPTDDELRAYLKLAEAATGGPWWTGDGEEWSYYQGADAVLAEKSGRPRVLAGTNVNFLEAAHADAAFIAASRTLGESSAREVLRLREALRKIARVSMWDAKDIARAALEGK
jgi:hypothetical protein